jgi:hypothetical protein
MLLFSPNITGAAGRWRTFFGTVNIMTRPYLDSLAIVPTWTNEDWQTNIGIKISLKHQTRAQYICPHYKNLYLESQN